LQKPGISPKSPTDYAADPNIEVLSNYSLPFWMRCGKHLRNEALAAEWETLRHICAKYRFGRVELLPVKKKTQRRLRFI
jgi:hypothetical protein